MSLVLPLAHDPVSNSSSLTHSHPHPPFKPPPVDPADTVTPLTADPAAPAAPSASAASTPSRRRTLRKPKTPPPPPPPPRAALPPLAPVRKTRARTSARVAQQQPVKPAAHVATRQSKRGGTRGCPAAELSETAWLKDELLPVRLIGSACDAAMSSRGRRREANWARAEVPELSSDEEEEVAEEMARYFRPRTEEEEELMGKAVEEMNPVGKPLSMTGKQGGKLTKEEQSGVNFLLNERAMAVRTSVARRPCLPFHDSPAKNVVLRLSDGDVQEDLLAMTGRDMATERKIPSPRKAASSAKADGGKSGSSRKRRLAAASDESMPSPAVAKAPPAKKSKSGSSSGNLGNDSRMFTKHSDKKGWVVCRKCRTSVWPPNCAKHVQHCSKTGG